MKRRTLWIIVAVLFALAVSTIFTVYGEHKIAISEQTIQDQINKQVGQEFPVGGMAKVAAKSIRLEAASVKIDTDSLAINFSVLTKMRFDKEVSIKSHVVGTTSFRKGEFYFDPKDVKIDKMSIGNGTLETLAQNISDKFIDNEKLKDLTNKFGLTAADWTRSIVEEATSRWLSNNPVYTLKGDLRGSLIKASLSSLDIRNGEIIATVTLWKMTLTIIIGLIALISAIALTYVLIKNPELGAVALLGSLTIS